MRKFSLTFLIAYVCFVGRESTLIPLKSSFGTFVQSLAEQERIWTTKVFGVDKNLDRFRPGDFCWLRGSSLVERLVFAFYTCCISRIGMKFVLATRKSDFGYVVLGKEGKK